jgi:hypothetical protein
MNVSVIFVETRSWDKRSSLSLDCSEIRPWFNVIFLSVRYANDSVIRLSDLVEYFAYLSDAIFYRQVVNPDDQRYMFEF